MGRVIAIVNEKGGVGKTTTSTTVSYLLGKEGKKVLLVDFDGQANSTMLMSDIKQNDIEVTISDIIECIINEKDMPENYIIKNKGIDLIPSSSELFALERNLTNVNFREYILKKFIDNIKDEYDYVIIDCMPQIGTPMINVMMASDSLIIPTQAEILSAKGLTELFKHYFLIKQANHNLKIDGVLITMDEVNTKSSKEVKKMLKEVCKEHINIFKTTIPKSIKVAEATIYRKTISEFMPLNKASQAYENLVKEILEIEQ